MNAFAASTALRWPGRLAALAAATAVLAAVSMLYLEPRFVVEIASSLWMCL